MSRKQTTRKYDSPLRKERREQTAELIVEAAAQEIAENGMVDLSMQKIAERARVSVRTLYRHFETRDDLLLAIGERLDRDMKGTQPMRIETWDDFTPAMVQLFGFFDANPEAVEAMHVTEVGRQIHTLARARRTERTRDELSKHLSDLPKDEFETAFAAMRAMFSSATWLIFRKDLGLSPEQSARVVEWMGNMFVGEITRRIERAKRGTEPEA